MLEHNRRHNRRRVARSQYQIKISQINGIHHLLQEFIEPLEFLENYFHHLHVPNSDHIDYNRNHSKANYFEFKFVLIFLKLYHLILIEHRG